MSNTIIDAIKRLELEISNKQTALEELRKMVGEELKPVTSGLKVNNSIVAESSMNKPFPINGATDKKIIFLFQNVFKGGQRMRDLQSTLDEYNGEHLRCDNVVRRMKDTGILSAVKYNNQNKMTFWGLNSWFNFEESDFKIDYSPSKDLLPFNIKTKEIITMDTNDMILN
ncbi:hypothetical protein SAMN05192545_3080 [Maribacter dokdonensis]|uniref:Uncharacterized protein n=1 Tax=Maribacter dokdonensis TaxID=320912 RepID=A0ABY0UV62_9FLAO|nr:hypothetical protein [Maribacter dokdonensis]SDT22499.1 hypothetical protein SAMN05192545_3080 [Maribacter dokdonensis]